MLLLTTFYLISLNINLFQSKKQFILFFYNNLHIKILLHYTLKI